MAKMDSDAVANRVNSYSYHNRHPKQRDIAWAQIYDENILKRHGIPFLTEAGIRRVQQLYEDQGGLQAPDLEVADESVLASEEDIITVRAREPVTPDRELDSQSTSSSFSLTPNWSSPSKSPSKSTSTSDRSPVKSTRKSPRVTKPASKALASPFKNSPATPKTPTTIKVKSPKTPDQPVSDVSFTPNTRLREKYGQLQISERSTTQESSDIPDNEIPVGSLRDDSLPARIITASIDLDTRSLKYTVQPLDKNFMHVYGHETRAVESGRSWLSAQDIEDDAEEIVFGDAVKHFDYRKLMEYVFEESEFGQDVWQNLNDMIMFPRLGEIGVLVDRFVGDDRLLQYLDDMEGDKEELLNNMVMDLVNLGNEAEVLLDRVNNLDTLDERREALMADGMKGVWKSLGTCFSVFLRRRAEFGQGG